MKILKSSKRRILNLIFLQMILLPSIFILVSPRYNVININSSIQKFLVEPNNIILNNDNRGVTNWDKMILSYDQNRNGLSDELEIKLNSDDNTKLIIQFPNDYDYTTATSIFNKNEGKLKFTYKQAINGFAGEIDNENFNGFYSELNDENIPFFIEEDHKAKAHLYYNSLNLNLRPYVWKSLNGGYTGDNDSSIAILDTGIDESHEFFDNFSDGDFRYKIVGWADFVGTIGPPYNTTRYDDNGHGSHVAGIAAGVGGPDLSANERTVSTTSLNLDYVGYSKPFPSGYYLEIVVASFNVTDPGVLDVECNFTDYTLGGDRMLGNVELRYGDKVLDYNDSAFITWEDNLTYTVDANSLGIYSLVFQWVIIDLTGDWEVWNPDSIFRGIIHIPFKPPELGCGDRWKGVAPKTHLVGAKVLDQNGEGFTSNIIRGIEWVINERETYNITVMSMSLGLVPNTASDQAMINAVNNAVNKGIVTVVSAGNDGPGGNRVSCPGDADYVITVAAMNYRDQITFYSSQGGPSYSTLTQKPDITAPGGSTDHLNMISADTNDRDAELRFADDGFANDTYPAQGTSMAAPVVAGAANLLIEAMGGGNYWDWSSNSTSLLVKAILLMTATETHSRQREDDRSSTPLLNRGGKDVHEGYGRINIDAAIEAWINDMTNYPLTNKSISVSLNTSYFNPYGKHAYAGYVDLTKDKYYKFNLTVPSGVDYDMHLYNSTPAAYGEPELIWSSKSPTKGKDEIFTYKAEKTHTYFLVIKAVGPPLPPLLAAEDDDDDDRDTEEVWDLTEFLLSPLGLLLVVGLVSIVVILIVLIARREKEDYAYRPDYSY